MLATAAATAALTGVLIGTSGAAASGPTCLGHAVTIKGTLGPDTLTGTDKPDVIDSFDGNDTIKGLGGNDLLCAGGGSDTVIGGPGAFTVVAEGHESFGRSLTKKLIQEIAGLPGKSLAAAE